MRTRISLTIGLFLIIAAILLSIAFISCQSGQTPPESHVGNVVDTLHGVAIADHYRWLEDQKSAETRTWVNAQNEYSQAYFASLSGREPLKQRYSELVRVDYVGTPSQKGNRYFLYKKDADQELYVLYMRDGLKGEDKVLLDPHTMSEDLSKNIGTEDITDDGKLMAYYVREGGADETSIKIMNVDTKEHFPDELPTAVYFGAKFTKDMKGLYYSKSVGEKSRVYYHEMGTDISGDKMIFGEGYGRDIIVSIEMSPNRRWLMLYVYYGSSSANDIYYMDLEGKGEIKTLVKGIDAYFEGCFADNNFLMITNWEAPNGRIFKINMNKPSQKNWKEIIPESENAIKHHSLAGGRLFVNYLINVSTKLKVFDLKGNNTGEISFPTLGSVGSLKGRWDSNDAFFSFTSFHYPSTAFHLNVTEGTREVWHKSDIPVNTDIFEVKQVWYKSKDGTEVPMFVVHAKGLKLDGNNPVLMRGYGGFRSSATPYFSSYATIFIENGGVYISPALRGGSEFGEKWHEAAMFENKQNTFDDFIAAAEWLIDNDYTKPSKIAIMGGSNGGLLVGACMTQRPDLYGAVICTYPLLDMVRYHKLLMGPYWVTEYGSAEEPDQFEYIYAYSPYHNVKKGEKYPATLFITGDADTRVDPMHARKMTALLQAETGSENPVLLMYDTKAGHSGGKPMRQKIEEAADELNFLFHSLGIK